MLRRVGRSADAREVALDVRHEHGDADAAEALGHALEGDGLAGPGGAGDQSVPVGELRKEEQITGGLGDQYRIGHRRYLGAARTTVGVDYQFVLQMWMVASILEPLSDVPH